MKIDEYCSNYFDFCSEYANGPWEMYNLWNNDSKTNFLATLKCLSYCTVVIPVFLGFMYGVACGVSSLCGRVTKKNEDSEQDEKVNKASKENLQPEPNKRNIAICKKLRDYTGDLTASQKSNLKASFNDEEDLSIRYKSTGPSITIKKQDILHSNSQVIINSASTDLKKGTGIDEKIHDKGGQEYARAHQELKDQYPSGYISGHAALLESGKELNVSHQVDNVIVVVEPKGETTTEKEKALYSCYYNSLAVADKKKKNTIAFPSISTGFPKDRAAAISLKAIYDFINANPNTSIKRISIHVEGQDAKSVQKLFEVATK